MSEKRAILVKAEGTDSRLKPSLKVDVPDGTNEMTCAQASKTHWEENKAYRIDGSEMYLSNPYHAFSAFDQPVPCPCTHAALPKIPCYPKREWPALQPDP